MAQEPEAFQPNCPLATGLRPCACDLPRCPVCNYTEHDAAFEMDHHLCKGVIPKIDGDGRDGNAGIYYEWDA